MTFGTGNLQAQCSIVSSGAYRHEQNKIYKREAFNQIRYIQGYWYEDTIIHFLVFRVCKSFSYINKPLYESHFRELKTPK